MAARGARRVALVTNVLSHYRVRCFEQLDRLFPGRTGFFVLTREMAHRSYVLADGDGPSLPVEGLPGWRIHRPPADDRHVNSILPVVRFRPDVVVLGGYDEPTYLMLYAWARATRTSLFFWVESTGYEGSRAGVRERVKRMLLGGASGCIVPGRRAAEYCETLGVAPDRIFVAPNATDRGYFRGQADRLAPERDGLRARLGFERPTVLFVGRLVEEYKAVASLIEAASLLGARGLDVTVALAGDGPDRAVYEALAGHLNVDVRFAGILSHERLVEYYAAADVLVLPSRSEPWGFVLNEGMEFGLPLAVSDAVGAGPDLVVEGENGVVWPAGDWRALADALEPLIRDPELRRRFGDRSRSLVQSFSPEAWADGVARAVEAAAR
jgi:glycosyltransferase involved in cell wall biosynthesis